MADELTGGDAEDMRGPGAGSARGGPDSARDGDDPNERLHAGGAREGASVPGPSQAPGLRGSAEASEGEAQPLRAVVVIGDLMIGSRVRDTMPRLGLEARFVGTHQELEEALRANVSIAIVDLGETRIDPREAIRAAHASGARVLAFGSHVDTAALRDAAAAGADKVVPRSLFASSLPALIEELMRRGPDGTR